MEQNFTVRGTTADEIIQLAKEEAERFFGDFSYEITRVTSRESDQFQSGNKIIARGYEADVTARIRFEGDK